MSMQPRSRRARRTVGSMLWAAWADALGFISELTNEAGLKRRLRGQPLTEPVEWTRRIGGKFGVDVPLPPGCYSDDTQLRLATARSVHGTGFDVEAFARIELAVWPAYALGGGRACKAAALQMAKPSTPWFGNFYDGWLDAGGNGVAMRIQPHVWSAPFPATLGQHVLDVITNGATSHGHPRALVGAVLHAVSLGAVLHDGDIPTTKRWPELLDLTDQAVKLVDNQPQLAILWRPAWESRTGTSFSDAWHRTVEECREILPLAAQAVVQLGGPEGRLNDDVATAYASFVDALNLRDPQNRGNATMTVLAALTLAAAAPADPAGVSRLAASVVGTDTDTIATMAAALSGATDAAPDPPSVLDCEYLTAEALRLAKIADGQATMPFSYPDLLHWTPPRAQLDAVGKAGDQIVLAGLGWLTPVEGTKPITARGTEWIWMNSDFGATFLVKQRATPRVLPDGQWPVRRELLTDPAARHARHDIPHDQLTLDENVTVPALRSNTSEASHRPSTRQSRVSRDEPAVNRDQISIDEMLTWVARRGYSPEAVGYATKRIAELGTVDQLVAFTTALRAAVRNHRG
jgi:ADP-ribosylglycohydrolase